ncbi:MAG TPA: hypothetical protein EYO24_04225, partial [Candidatus Marinimicrobia bacterium]|nr:hypothetical protein [Candidatus Neomarinimicrobiota bacterium]
MNKLSTALCFLLPLTLASGEPQEEVESPTQTEKALAQDEKTVKAVRTQNPVYIDGELTEMDWYGSDLKKDFIQYAPVNGDSATEKTAFLILYDDENLYLGVYVAEQNPSSVMGALRRKDDMALSDYIWLYIDTENRGRSGYKFGVNP